MSTESLKALPLGFAARVGWDSLGAPFRRPAADTFAAVLEAKLGPTISRHFYLPYARKIWGLEPTRLAGEQARRRVTADSPFKMVKRIFSGGGGTGRNFWYPRRGYGQITEVLTDAAAKEGADVRLSSEVTRLVVDGNEVSATLRDGGFIQADMVWSTLPLTVLARMTDGAPQDVLAAASTLRFRSMVLVYLVLQSSRYTAFDAHYLPESWTPVTRISEPKNYRDGDDPADRTVLCAEIPCDLGDDIWTADDGSLAEVVKMALRRSELPVAELREVHTERIAHAYPIYTEGYEEQFALLDGWASRLPGLVTFGRQGLFAHDNLHHALAMAWSAAAALREDGSWDEVHWEEARERFKAHVVED